MSTKISFGKALQRFFELCHLCKAEATPTSLVVLNTFILFLKTGGHEIDVRVVLCPRTPLPAWMKAIVARHIACGNLRLFLARVTKPSPSKLCVVSARLTTGVRVAMNDWHNFFAHATLSVSITMLIKGFSLLNAVQTPLSWSVCFLLST